MRAFLTVTLLFLLVLSSHAQDPDQKQCKITPTAPPNAAGNFSFDSSKGRFYINYNGSDIITGQVFIVVDGKQVPLAKSNSVVTSTTRTDAGVSASGIPMITQRISLYCGKPIVLKGEILTSNEGLAAEIGTKAQKKFPMIRNTVGAPSSNLRNDAVYDRMRDWLISPAVHTAVHIIPLGDSKMGRRFSFEAAGTSLELDFRPHYYQAHKNIAYFEPWTYKIWPNSVAGWCSWWPYKTNINETIVSQISDVFSKKLKDYGFDYIQIDDGYQYNGYGTPEVWLKTYQSRFPNGLVGLHKIIKDRGLKPALWVNVHFSDPPTLEQHPEYFLPGPDGKPFSGPWIENGIDGTNQKALDALVNPVYKTLHQQGWEYIKVDALRHLLYDAYYPNREYFAKKNTTPEDVFRHYLTEIRNDLGRDTYMLACWGVLPEVAGIADACRLGGDGFGPTTLLQYNSWNNIVWRNDPDHMDITGAGEEWIRPAMVTMSGAQMLLTDKVEVYDNDNKIEGSKRCGPILFTVPGQLYDYDPTKTDNLVAGMRNKNGGSDSGPIDADRHGTVSNEWWMMEINRPFDSWNVLARMDYKDLPRTQVNFSDLGLSGDKEYLVFEYRSTKFLGICKGSFTAPAQKAKDVSVYAIREYTGKPQLLATSRHITCGGPDIEALNYKGGILSGSSKVVANDPYRIYIYLPAGYSLGNVKASGAKVVSSEIKDGSAVVTLLSEKNASVKWAVNTVNGN